MSDKPGWLQQQEQNQRDEANRRKGEEDRAAGRLAQNPEPSWKYSAKPYNDGYGS